jgi:hypothetical protein
MARQHATLCSLRTMHYMMRVWQTGTEEAGDSKSSQQKARSIRRMMHDCLDVLNCCLYDHPCHTNRTLLHSHILTRSE